MLLAVDVDYRPGGGAVAAGALFGTWGDAQAAHMVIRHVPEVAPYRPGRFFERELPCILAVLAGLDLPETIVIDGYVQLGGEGRDGLGAHLHRALDGKVPVIGIAKTRFRDTPPETELLRGGSDRPLYVTSAGIDPTEARRLVGSMHGPHRIPTILTAVDRACRSGGPK